MKRWTVILQSRLEHEDDALKAVQTRFPDVKFKKGVVEEVFPGIEGGKMRNIKALVPTPHPNDETQKIVDGANEIEAALCKRTVGTFRKE